MLSAKQNPKKTCARNNCPPHGRCFTLYLGEREFSRKSRQRPLVQLVIRQTGCQTFEADDVVHRYPVNETDDGGQNLDLHPFITAGVDGQGRGMGSEPSAHK